jgi:flagellar hook-associated protein FlgK
MLSSFGSLNIALSTLQSMQRAIAVTGHNVANASTTGYSRQAALLVPSDPYSVPAVNRNASLGQVGTGVTVDMVQKYRSDFLDSQLRNETLLLTGWEVRRDTLSQIEVIFNEPSDTALNTNLSNLWNSWYDLSATPDSTAARAEVVGASSALSASMREVHSQFGDFQTELDNRVALQVDSVNDLANRIADLNRTITDVEALFQQANDLRDQRTLLLQELAGLINITAFESESGSMLVSIGGKLLVQDHVVSEIAVENDPNNYALNRVVWSDTGNVVRVGEIPLEGGLSDLAMDRLSGELGATLIARDLILPQKMAQLDDIANAIITSVNGLHQIGFGPSNAPGGTILAQTPTAGTVDSFSMVAPLTGNPGLADGTYYVEIRDNADTLEFRLVDSSGAAVDIYDAAAADGSLTSSWQTLNLVDGGSFDTGRGLQIDFGAIVDHSLSAINTNGNVSGFDLGEVTQGTAELPTGTYYMEVRDNGGVDEFRLVDSGGTAVAVYDNNAADGSLTDGWQTIPTAPASFDTHRGLTVDFSGGPYVETLFGGVPLPASVGYTARGTATGTYDDGAASVDMGNFFTGTGAANIAVSDYITADHSRIATAAAADSPGDGSIGLAIARLENAQLLEDNSTTVGDYYRAAVSNLGQEAAQADVMADNHQLLFNHLEEQQEQIAGVSLDEEAVSLIQFQRTYQAAARVMTTMDEMLNKIINGMGVVGR